MAKSSGKCQSPSEDAKSDKKIARKAAAAATHAHERSMHPGQKLTKLAGASASGYGR